MTDRQELYRHNREFDFTSRIPEEGCVVIYREGNSATGIKSVQYFVSFEEDDSFREASGEGYVFHNFADFLKQTEAVIKDGTTRIERDRQVRERALRRAQGATPQCARVHSAPDDPKQFRPPQP